MYTENMTGTLSSYGDDCNSAIRVPHPTLHEFQANDRGNGAVDRDEGHRGEGRPDGSAA